MGAWPGRLLAQKSALNRRALSETNLPTIGVFAVNYMLTPGLWLAGPAHGLLGNHRFEARAMTWQPQKLVAVREQGGLLVTRRTS